MEIADHAGETNGPEPVEETGARHKGEENILLERKRTKRGGRGGREGGERAVSRRQSPSTVAGVTTG